MMPDIFPPMIWVYLLFLMFFSYNEKIQKKNIIYIQTSNKLQVPTMFDLVEVKNFKLVQKLGQGSFGQVFKGVHNVKNAEVAIKIEKRGTKNQQIFSEAKILRYLTNSDVTTDFGVPHSYFYGTEGDYNVLIMDLYGESLMDLFETNGCKFDLKTTLMIGYQMIERIEYVHGKHYLHRDVKPENFVMGNGKKAHRLYLIDFGIAKKYLTEKGQHIPYRDQKSFVGTARFASLNTHLGIQQGRRDDIEGIANVLLYFIKGSLPWQNLKAKGEKQLYEKIKEKKMSISLDKLCKNLPEEFKLLFVHSRTLQFDQKPDYELLKKYFTDMMIREQIEMDYKYCWEESSI